MKFSEAQKVQLVMSLTFCDHETGLKYLRAANGITMDAVDLYRKDKQNAHIRTNREITRNSE